MSLFAMDMPETHAELVDWLEEHLVGLDLAALVAELSAIHGADVNSPDESDASSMVNILRGRIPDVMEGGLSTLDPEQVSSLLQHPRCLLELQELVLTSGGEHWEKRMEDSAGSEFQQIAESGWRRVKLAIAPPLGTHEDNGQTSATAADTITGESATETALPTVRKGERQQPRERPTRSRSLWPAVLTTAALLLLGAFGLQQVGLMTFNLERAAQLAGLRPPPPAPEAPQGWGWERPGAIPQDVPPVTYLNSLAHAADEWFNKRPADRDGVAKRISDFRDGCSTLIAASHDPLAEQDRTWLVDKCEVWRDKLDAHLAALEEGEDPLAVRAAADETITNLIAAMRSRADEIA